jgi:trans-aconitate methyltransferase
VIDRLKARLRPLGAYRAARFGWHFLTDPIFRRDHLLGWKRPKDLFQFRSITAPNRYPRIFSVVQTELAAVPVPKLLSFGCATGEEVFSLRDHFPRAEIRGLDINPGNIATCRARLHQHPDPAISFATASTADAEAAGSFDAVFALAVFQHPSLKRDPAIATCEPLLNFADFERIVRGLAASVKPGGCLAVRHAMFRFMDTAVARDFTVVLELPVESECFPRFGRNNRRVPDAVTEAVVFRKKAH